MLSCYAPFQASCCDGERIHQRVNLFPAACQRLRLTHLSIAPAQATQPANTVAAEMMGWQDRIGSIMKGEYADIIGLSGDLLMDITELERVKFVMKGARASGTTSGDNSGATEGLNDFRRSLAIEGAMRRNPG